jgi:hypothetical protein
LKEKVYEGEIEEGIETEKEYELTYIFLVPGNGQEPRKHWFICSAVLTIVTINIYKQYSSSIVR